MHFQAIQLTAYAIHQKFSSFSKKLVINFDNGRFIIFMYSVQFFLHLLIRKLIKHPNFQFSGTICATNKGNGQIRLTVLVRPKKKNNKSVYDSLVCKVLFSIIL